MRERKYVKFRVDMHDDTKSKIIDRMSRRDLIHYVWNRFVLLAGKVNKEGDLYMSRNIPYTIETLSIEFNRDIDEIKIALDVLIELEMMELTEDKVYKVKNFAKHQNIKVKEKNETKNEEKIVNDKANNIDDKEINVNDEKNQVSGHASSIIVSENMMVEAEAQAESVENEECTGKNEDINGKLNEFNVTPVIGCIDLNSDNVNKIDDTKDKENSGTNQHNDSAVILEMKKNQKSNRKSKKVSKKKIRDDIIETGEENLYK